MFISFAVGMGTCLDLNVRPDVQILCTKWRYIGMSKITSIDDVPVYDEAEEVGSEPEKAASPVAAKASGKEWYDVLMHPKFLKAVLLTAVVIALVFVSPLSRYVKERVPALDNMPHSTECLNAVIAACIVTFLRPPQ